MKVKCSQIVQKNNGFKKEPMLLARVNGELIYIPIISQLAERHKEIFGSKIFSCGDILVEKIKVGMPKEVNLEATGIPEIPYKISQEDTREWFARM